MAKWKVDQSHSSVGFEVKHMMVSKVKGQFDSYTADVEAADLAVLKDGGKLKGRPLRVQMAGNSAKIKRKKEQEEKISLLYCRGILYAQLLTVLQEGTKKEQQ